RLQVAQRRGAGHAQHIALATLAQCATKLRVVTQLIITRDPAVRHLSPPRVEHLHTQLLAGVVPPLRRHVACLASWRIPGPLLRQRQTEVEQGVIVVRDVAMHTLTWQLSTFPRWPHHWRFTPTACVPRLGKLLGSKAMIPSGAPNRAATWP